MNTFNKKSLPAAIACIGALGVTGAAEAVYVNPDGLGQALIYPYYTVRATSTGASYQSLISVVNSTASAKAVKVRFLEGKNSREVLDFNLFLSRHDVWVGAVIATSSGAGIFTPDKSCTMPPVSADPASPTAFVNFAYTGSAADGGDASLDRTREGYVEVIEMADIIDGTPTWTTVTHVSSVPPCKASILQSPSTGVVNAQLASDTVASTGGIFGGITLVNSLAALDVASEATAFAAFSTSKLLFAEGSTFPDLSQVNPKTSVVINTPTPPAAQTTSTIYITQWSGILNNPADPVSAVLMHNNIYNEFVLDTVTKSGTDWVVTMPTKRYYYTGGQIVDANGNVIGVALQAAPSLFQRNFVNGKACDDVAIVRYDREENTVTAGTTFSPPPPTQTDSICYEANVITYNNSNVLDSVNVANIPTTFQNGWVSLTFAPATSQVGGQAHVLTGASTITQTITAAGTVTPGVAASIYTGLPTIGYAVSTFNNGTLTDSTGAKVNATYSGRIAHRFTRQIQ